MKIYKKIVSLLTIGVLSVTMTVGCGKREDSTKVLNVYNVGDYIDEELITKFEEETGIKEARAITNDICSIDILPVNAHIKKGKYVASHLHLSVAYILEADEKEKLVVKEDENSGVKWVDIDKVLDLTSEEHMKTVYKKLIDKSKMY